MPKCSSCSAPLTKVLCEYCGTRNDIDLTHLSNFSDTRPSETRYCPSCELPLVTINLSSHGTMYIERCGRCFGLFFDKGELQSLLEMSVEHRSDEVDFERLAEIAEHTYHKDSVEYRRCPVCKEYMQRKNYLRRSGVIYDRCIDHGIWLDAGELKQIMEFIRLGGENLSQENDKEYTTYAKESVLASKSEDIEYFKNEKNMTWTEAMFLTFQDIANLF